MYNTFIIPKDIHCLKTMEYRNQKSATCCKYNKPHSYPAEDEGYFFIRAFLLISRWKSHTWVF